MNTGPMPGIFLPADPFLKTIVRFIAFLEFPAADPGLHMSLFPNCTTNLSITLKGGVILGNRQAKGNFASTSCLSPMVLDRSQSISMLNVQFEPFGLHALLGLPMDEFADKLPALDILFKASHLESLYNQVADAPDPVAAVRAVEEFLLKASRGVLPDTRITTGVRLLQGESKPAMDRLSQTLCLSNRGVRKLFNKTLGTSPKQYANLARFNQAIRKIALQPQMSLTQIAYDLGYFDQSHFNREFKKYSGITPKAFKRLPAKSTEFYNFIPEGPITFGMT